MKKLLLVLTLLTVTATPVLGECASNAPKIVNQDEYNVHCIDIIQAIKPRNPKMPTINKILVIGAGISGLRFVIG